MLPITLKTEKKEEIKHGNDAGNRCYYTIKHMFKSRTVSKLVKIKLYKTII